ncbi:ABC transporter substrate-binding protein [Kocuria sp. JC486]|uniref:ABC transporter substrate-binding protein n=1 Tax=Kocuria soli TaxID=2485125 RepID=A0A3N3ZNG5_9MICC|nr:MULTISPECIES: ABC transporter substrate-binding protein [Kocuria]NHU85581.1 ABC transporter substrate-binding protein [Kocuria sp. JC486]ROZ62332.1 ABC transporter substrate-binding protein [Kocuria soli]
MTTTSPTPGPRAPRFSRRALLPAAVAGVLVLSACGSSDPLAEDDQSAGSDDGAVTVGSADFPESQIIAELYAGVLRDAGVEATTEPGIGAREAYVSAVEDGSIDLVPDYTGNLLLYVDSESKAASADEIMAELPDALPEGLTVLEPSEAENKDAMVVTQDTADEYSLTSISDMASVCGELVIAGPPEFQERAYGLPGLESKYNCVPESFEPINDGGGSLTVDTLTRGDADVANIFTTTPAIEEQNLVVLEDPENNFIAQQVIPLAAEDRLPEGSEDALNELSSKLTTEDLIELNQAVSGDGAVSPQQAAQKWLEENGYDAA